MNVTIDKVSNLIKDRKDKTPLILESKVVEGKRTTKEIAFQDYDFKEGDMFFGVNRDEYEVFRIKKIKTKKQGGKLLSSEDECIEIEHMFLRDMIRSGVSGF